MRAANLFLLLAIVTACDRPTVKVICHNANCVEPTKPEDDDTLEAMRASLAVRIDGKPAFDALEVDSYWRATDDACLFAHDLTATRTTTIDEMVTELAAYIAATPDLTRHPGPFRVFIELKQHVDADATVPHNAAQRAGHVDCVWRAYETLATASVSSGHPIEVVFSSFGPDLLRELVARKPASTPVPYLLDTFYGVPHPLTNESHPLDEFKGIPIDIVEVHPQWMTDSQYEGLRSMNVEIVFWMFSATTEIFNAIDQYEPDGVGTSEVRLMDRWLER